MFEKSSLSPFSYAEDGENKSSSQVIKKEEKSFKISSIKAIY